MKKYFWRLSFGVTLLLACILRFYKLGIVPQSVNWDELGYIYNAWSIAITARNIFGQFFPLFTWVAQGGFPFMPVPMYMTAAVVKIFGLSAFAGRLPDAILGVLDVALLYYIVIKIFKNPPLALLSAVFLAVSPWHLHFSRTAYDTNFALFFYLGAIASYAYAIHKKQLPALSLISLFLAIYSYRGSIVLFPFIAMALYWYGTIQRTSPSSRRFFIIGSGVIATLLFITIISAGPGYTAESKNLFQNPQMIATLKGKMDEAHAPLWIKRIFLNKPMYVADSFRENYLKVYSPEFLFLYTEPNAIYSIWSRGRIYTLDALFIILGVAYLYSVNKKAAMFWTALLLIGGLPGGIGGQPYSARTFFLSAVLPVCTAGGILFVAERLRWKYLRLLFMTLIVISYAYLLGSYLFDYYARYAYTGAEAWGKSIKDMSLYVKSRQSRYSNVLVSTTSVGDVLSYAFYAHTDPVVLQHALQNTRKYYVFGNTTFQYACLEDRYGRLPPVTNGSLLYLTRDQCHTTQKPDSVIQDYAGNTIWKAYSIPQ